MEIIIDKQSVFKGYAFLLNKERNPYSKFQGNEKIFLTQEDNCSLKNEILSIINSSLEVIKICSFVITDVDIYEALLKKAKETDVSIFLLTQLSDDKIRNTGDDDFLTAEEIKDNSAQRHLDCIKALYDQGVHVRASEIAHAKFVIADKKVGFITSANLTTLSLSLNTELGLYLDEAAALELNIIFDTIFLKGTKYRKYIAATKNKVFVVQNIARIDRHELPLSLKSRIRYTYDNITDNLYKEIIRLIDTASDFIYISTYCIVKIENLPEFVQAIKSAVNRGVRVNVFCRGMNYRGDHISSVGKLHSLGCQIFADIYNHSKGIVNEKEGFVFTANIDGRHGLKNGFEVGYILDENERQEYVLFFDYLISISIYKFTQNPIRVELFETYRFYERIKKLHPPQIPLEISISLPQDVSINISEFLELPIHYSISKPLSIIQVKNRNYQCEFGNGKFHILEFQEHNPTLEKYILKYDKLKIEYK